MKHSTKAIVITGAAMMMAVLDVWFFPTRIRKSL